MWIDTGSRELPAGVEDKIKSLGLRREDKTDAVWFNLDTGASLILVCVGGWREAATSYFKLFHLAPGADLYDVTFPVLGEVYVKFDAAKHALETYAAVKRDAVAAVSARLGAVRLWETPAEHR